MRHLLTELLFVLVPALSLEIVHVFSPGPMRNGTNDVAILDCDYDLDERDKVAVNVCLLYTYIRQFTIECFALIRNP